jgi:hypothetical protein
VNDSAIRDRIIAKREAIILKIANLQSSLDFQKTLLAELDALLEGDQKAPAVTESTPTETPTAQPRRRGRPKLAVQPAKKPQFRAPFRRLSVAKAVQKAIENIEGEFSIGDLVDAIYESDADTDTKRVKFAVTNEISDLYRKGAGIERVRRGVYRRSEGTSQESTDTPSSDIASAEEPN